jgi:hypothetical protein
MGLSLGPATEFPGSLTEHSGQYSPELGHRLTGPAIQTCALTATALPPADFQDLSDVDGSFLQVGGEFLVAEIEGDIVGMGGFRPDAAGQAEILRVRAARMNIRRLHLRTATNQPEAMAFYQSLGWTLVRDVKAL